jgi:hypothetical protein
MNATNEGTLSAVLAKQAPVEISIKAKACGMHDITCAQLLRFQ